MFLNEIKFPGGRKMKRGIDRRARILWTLAALFWFGCSSTGFQGSSGGSTPTKPSPAKKPTQSSGVKGSGPTPTTGNTQAPLDSRPVEGTVSTAQPDSAPTSSPTSATVDTGDTAPIDPSCSQGGSGDISDFIFPAKGPALPATAPADCRAGFEMNNLEMGIYEISGGGARRDIQLEIDYATYLQADGVRITAIDGGNAKLIFDSCRMRTALYKDPTGGAVRPPEDSIRSFRVTMPAGARTLRFDFQNATSPNYIRVLGLCDFNLSPSQDVAVGAWRTL